MAFTTSNSVKSDLARVLHQDEADLSWHWDGLITDGISSAYQEILGVMLARGYTASQINAWDRGEEFERDIALYWTLVKGAGLANYDDRYIVRYDRREELKSVNVVVDGVLVAPTGEGSSVGSGPLNDNYQTFKYSVDGSGTVTDTEW